MDPGRQVIQQFEGVALDVHRSSLPDGLFQEDVGGDRFDVSRWRRRRGMRRTDVPKKADVISTVLGFEMNSTQFGLLMAHGTDVQGFVNVAQQSFAAGGGYGDSEYGNEGYGE